MPRGTPFSIEHNGQRLSLRQYSDLTGIPFTTLRERFKRGQSGQKLASRPDTRYGRSKKEPRSCLSSLLAGWKLAPGASDQQMECGPSAECS